MRVFCQSFNSTKLLYVIFIYFFSVFNIGKRSLLDGGNNRDFNYIWIVRCKGGSVNRNVECRLTPQAPTNGLKPLIEVVDLDLFQAFTNHMRKKFSEIMVDFPLYLLERHNKFSDSVQELVAVFPDPTKFFVKYKSYIDIPVVSANHSVLLDYNLEKRFLQNLKPYFEKLAVRVRVPTVDLREATGILSSYNSLLDVMRKNDTFF